MAEIVMIHVRQANNDDTSKVHCRTNQFIVQRHIGKGDPIRVSGGYVILTPVPKVPNDQRGLHGKRIAKSPLGVLHELERRRRDPHYSQGGGAQTRTNISDHTSKRTRSQYQPHTRFYGSCTSPTSQAG